MKSVEKMFDSKSVNVAYRCKANRIYIYKNFYNY